MFIEQKPLNAAFFVPAPYAAPAPLLSFYSHAAKMHVTREKGLPVHGVFTVSARNKKKRKSLIHMFRAPSL